MTHHASRSPRPFKVIVFLSIACCHPSVGTAADQWPVKDAKPSMYNGFNTYQKIVSGLYVLHPGIDIPAPTQNPKGKDQKNEVILPRKMKLFKIHNWNRAGVPEANVEFTEERVVNGTTTTYYAQFHHLDPGTIHQALTPRAAEGREFEAGQTIGFIGNFFADPVPDHLHVMVSTNPLDHAFKQVVRGAVNPLVWYDFGKEAKDPGEQKPEITDRSNPCTDTFKCIPKVPQGPPSARSIDADGEEVQFVRLPQGTYLGDGDEKTANGEFILSARVPRPTSDVDIVIEVQDQMGYKEWFPDVYSSGYYVKATKDVIKGHDVKSMEEPYVLFTARKHGGNLAETIYVKPFAFNNWELRYHLEVTNTKGTTGKDDEVERKQYWNTNAASAGDFGGNGVGAQGANDTLKAENAHFPDGLYDVHCFVKDVLNTTWKTKSVHLSNYSPAVKLKKPAGGRNVAGGTPADACIVVIEFSEAMNQASVESALTWIKVGGGSIPFTPSWNAWGGTVTLLTDARMEYGEYEVTINADVAKDLYLGEGHTGDLLDSEFGASAHNGTSEGHPTDSVSWTFTCRLEGCCLDTLGCEDLIDVESCIGSGGTPVSGCLDDLDNNGQDDACEACCQPDGACAAMGSAACQQLGGQSFLSACQGLAPCCSLSDLSCEELEPSCCLGRGGAVVGEPSCSLREEACCLANGACETADPLCCAASGGALRGDGVACVGDGNTNGIDDTCEMACCRSNGTCIAVVGSDDCQSVGGALQVSGPLCHVTEACCFADGTCRDLNPSCCEEIGGMPQGAGTAARASEACCFADGACQELDPLGCALLGGAALGLGATCQSDAGNDGVDDACAAPQACCAPSGGCAAIGPSGCLSQGGEPLGPRSTCGVSAACCFIDRTCAALDSVCCEEQGGLSQAEGSVCLGDSDNDDTDDACQVPQACCLPEGVCNNVPPLACLDMGGLPRGAGSICTTAEACCIGAECQMVDPLCCLHEFAAPAGRGTMCGQDENHNDIDDACELKGACCDHDPFEGCTDDVPEADCGCDGCNWFENTRCEDIECLKNAIPTASQWGLSILTLLLLIGTKIIFGRSSQSVSAP
jgi:hypothetical protein